MDRTQLFTLTFVRHGETLSNRNRIMQGQLDTTLSDVGHQQARLVGVRLKDQHFTHAFSSDLSRASQTARHILEENMAGSSCELVLDNRLRERSFGWLEGKPHEVYRKALEESGKSSHVFTPEGGETPEQLAARARDFYKYLCQLMSEPLATPDHIQRSSEASPGNHSNSLARNASGSDMAGRRQSCEDVPTSRFSCCLPKSTSSTDVLATADKTRSSSNPDPQVTKPSLTVSDRGSSLTRPDLIHKPLSVDVGSTADSDRASVLVVSHGMLLRELQKAVLDTLKGGVIPEHSVSPNTGVTQVTMSVTIKYGKVKASCVACHCINNASHLGGSSDDLAKLAIFRGAL